MVVPFASAPTCLHLGLCLSFAVLGGCSSSRSDSVTPFPLGRAVVYGPEAGGAPLDVTSSCQSDVCSAVMDRCGGQAYAEVMLDRDGAIADVVCYRGDVHMVELGSAPRIGLDDEPDTMFVFDAVDDGPDLYGDSIITQDNVALFGAGIGVSVVGGRLGIEGGGATVRALRIIGDVSVDQNGAKLSLVEIDGDLVINADDVTVTESIVHGRVYVNGSRTLLVRNLIGDNAQLAAPGLKCNLNQQFNDVDRDGVVDRAERGGEVSCS